MSCATFPKYRDAHAPAGGISLRVCWPPPFRSAAKTGAADEVPAGKLPADAIASALFVAFHRRSAHRSLQRRDANSRSARRSRRTMSGCTRSSSTSQRPPLPPRTAKRDRPSRFRMPTAASSKFASIARCLPEISISRSTTPRRSTRSSKASTRSRSATTRTSSRRWNRSARAYAFPGFDEPRFKTPFDITLTVPTDEVAVANTRAARAEDIAPTANGRR